MLFFYLSLINACYNEFKGEETHASLSEINQDIFVSDHTKSFFAVDSKSIALTGDFVEDPSVIPEVGFVMKKGIAYDPLKLIPGVEDHTSSENDDLLTYLGQKKPGMEPERFAPNLISKNNEYELGSVFSEDGTEFYFGVDKNGKAEIRFARLEKSDWTSPQPLVTHQLFSFNDPFLSPDENRLYYISDMPRDELSECKTSKHTPQGC